MLSVAVGAAQLEAVSGGLYQWPESLLSLSMGTEMGILVPRFTGKKKMVPVESVNSYIS